MYPSAELTELGQRKSALRARIAGSRLACSALAGEVARPLNWIDRGIEQWRRIPPMAKIAALPLGLLLRRAVFPAKKTHLAGKAVRLLPLVMGAFKLFKAQRR
jgi:hypothetical protein